MRGLRLLVCGGKVDVESVVSINIVVVNSEFSRIVSVVDDIVGIDELDVDSDIRVVGNVVDESVVSDAGVGVVVNVGDIVEGVIVDGFLVRGLRLLVCDDKVDVESVVSINNVSVVDDVIGIRLDVDCGIIRVVDSVDVESVASVNVVANSVTRTLSVVDDIVGIKLNVDWNVEVELVSDTAGIGVDVNVGDIVEGVIVDGFLVRRLRLGVGDGKVDVEPVVSIDNVVDNSAFERVVSDIALGVDSDIKAGGNIDVVSVVSDVDVDADSDIIDCFIVRWGRISIGAGNDASVVSVDNVIAGA